MFDVIYYIYYDELETLGPYLYGIQMWRETGHDVTVYSLTDDKGYNRLPTQIRLQFKHHTVRFSLWLKICALGLKSVGFVFRKLFRLRTRGSDWAKALEMGYFALYCYQKTSKEERHILIATDPAGLWAAALASRKYGHPYVYFVKEIFLSGDVRNVFDRAVKYLERKANRKALYTVEFDETRAEMLRRDNSLTLGSILCVPNASIGTPNQDRGMYFRDMFGIGEDKKIALYTGGISNLNLTYEHIASTKMWPRDVVLVMHCWGSEIEMSKVRNFASRFNREIYFSSRMLRFNEVEKIYSSCDIGLALYGDQDLNHKYTGMASGKMFSFMKACVPIITNNTPSCKKAVEETGCGICIEEMSEIGIAIRQILEKESEFRANCEKHFRKFSFDRNYINLIEVLEGVIIRG